MSDGGTAGLYEWFDRVGFAVDRAALHGEFRDVTFHDFESWAKTQDWNALLQSACRPTLGWLSLHEIERRTPRKARIEITAKVALISSL